MVAKRAELRLALPEAPFSDPTTRRRGLTAVAGLLLGLTFANPANASEYDPNLLPGSLYNTTHVTGAQAYWAAGYTGKGVDVAVIDTGAAPVGGLTAPGKVVDGVDVSFDAPSDTFRHLDGYGHGTHMASIIAGRDEGAAAPYVGNRTHFLGMAPDSRVLSVKVGDSSGAVDVSQVIAAIDWVVQHRRDDGLNVRVLNLSYGTDSLQAHDVDPLMHAVENAWKQGIVVVVATGNDGDSFVHASESKGLASPARDPRVIAVGAADTMGTATLTDDTVARFSTIGVAKGTTERNPDLVAPGVSLVGLKVPGSVIDVAHGATAGVGDRFIRGSGTSQAAAVVSGAAALIIQQRPGITPDQVKRLLRDTATPLAFTSTQRQGRGELDLRRTLNAATPSVAVAAQAFLWGNGTGSLESARGSHHLEMDGVPLVGELDVFGLPVATSALALNRTAGTAWLGGLWNGVAYAGDVWGSASWTGRSWTGRSWTGRSWTGRSWTGRSWTGRSWTGRSWTGEDWSSNTSFLGRSWTGKIWSSADWR